MTLQEQYNSIKGGKGHKGIFLTEAKAKFPDMLTNPMGFEEATKILKTRGVISENYVDLKPSSTLELSPKQPWENKFAQFLAEEAKSVEKKVTKEVEDTQSHNYDYKDKSNLDNQIGQEVLNGIYFEGRENPDKTLDELREMVAKNLAKDGQYYMKNAAFGVKGLGYKETEVEEVAGKYASSGYSDKLKKLVKESLIKESSEPDQLNDESVNEDKSPEFKKGDKVTYLGHPGEITGVNKEMTGAITYNVLYDKGNGKTKVSNIYNKGGEIKASIKEEVDPELLDVAQEQPLKKKVKKESLEENPSENMEEGIHDKDITSAPQTNIKTPPKGVGDYNPAARAANLKRLADFGSKKSKPKSLDSELSEIDTQAGVVAMEAKLDKIDSMIQEKSQRLTMIDEDTNLSELVDKSKIKLMQKEIKILEKMKAKMGKVYEKMTGKTYTKEEIVDESEYTDE